jgi:predicted RND superfamily exporter protein
MRVKRSRLWPWFEGSYARYSRFTLRHPLSCLGLLLLVCVPAFVLDARFFGSIRTGLQDLLPADAPSVRSMDAIHARLGGESHLTVIAQSDDAVRNRAFIKELAGSLDALKLPVIRLIQWNVDEERHWIADHAALLMPRADFDHLSERLDSEVHAQKLRRNPLALDLGDSPEAAGGPSNSAQWQDLEDQLDKSGKSQDRFPNGTIETPDGHTVVMLIWLRGSELELGPAETLEKAVAAQVGKLLPRYPGLKTAYNGEVPNLIEEHYAILQDLSLSSLLVFVLVGALIVFYFRSLRAVLAVVFALVPGLACTFAVGRLTSGSLNSNSVFLGSIIAGNGINYPLILLAYFQISPRALPRGAAYLRAARQALPGTLGAAATASAAYAGLASAHFRGFSEFGWLGGFGMLTTWACCFLTMPIAIGLFQPPRHDAARDRESFFASLLYSRPARLRTTAVVFVGISLVVAAFGIRRAMASGLYETNLNALRNRESLAHGGASWDRKMSEIFGVWLNPVVALVDDPAKREAAATALRGVLLAPDHGLPPAERVETIESVVPAPAEQSRRLEILKRAKRILGSAEDVPPRVRELIERRLSDRSLQPIAAADVPAVLTQGFREVDGRFDRVTLIYPSIKINYNDADNVLRFADALHRARLPPGTVVGGSFLFMAEIIRLVEDEAPRVVLIVCLLVVLVLVPIFLKQPRRVLLCIVTVAAVAFTAQAIMLALGVRVNMFNFAAVPITIGVGSDYVVNLFGAMDAFACDARRAAAKMGGAILLASLTTVVGYLSLVIAQSGALRTFGWAAVLGEIMAVCTVLLVLPALSKPLGAPVRREAGQTA